MNSLKAKLEKFENNTNLPKNLQDLPPMKLPPANTPTEVVTLGNLPETKVVLKGNVEHESSEMEDDDTDSSDSESDLTSDYPIYSNDNENMDEIISVNVTENLNEDVQKILEDALNRTENMSSEKKHELIDNSEELKLESNKEDENDENENQENEVEKKLDVDNLDKLKKDEITSLALKYQISLLKSENGKMKNKTKKELIDEIMLSQNKTQENL
jgi:hypothetical protein